MPCRSEPDVQVDFAEKEILTRLACAYCRNLEANNRPIPDYAVDWWTRHKAWDERRKKEEEAKRKNKALAKQARAKLTPEELAALRFID